MTNVTAFHVGLLLFLLAYLPYLVSSRPMMAGGAIRRHRVTENSREQAFQSTERIFSDDKPGRKVIERIRQLVYGRPQQLAGAAEEMFKPRSAQDEDERPL